MKEKVLVARATFPDIIERLATHFDVERNESDVPFTPDELRRRIRDKAGAMLMGMERIDASVLAVAPRLRAVSNCAAGYNNFDLPALTRAGIVATNTPEVSDESVADLAWALMMATSRRLPESDAFVRSGDWKGFAYNLMLGVDLHGTTLGIIGMGRIGRAIARRAAGFRMKVVYHNRRKLDAALEAEADAVYSTKEALLRQADHVILTLPYSEAAHHLIGAPELAQMKATATLINVARGGIVDDAALGEALSAGRLAGAGLDVFEGEPVVHPALLGAPNLVMTPHIGSASTGTRRALANLAVDNLIAALGYGPTPNRPRFVLNADALDERRAHRALQTGDSRS